MNLIDQLAGALFPGVSSGGSMGAMSMLPDKPMGLMSMLPGGPGGAMSLFQPAALGGPVPSAAPAAPPVGATPPPALANALGAILKQSGAVPQPPKAEPAVERPARAPVSRLQPSGGISAPQPSQGGISGQDVSSIIKAALMGAANVNPGSPMGSAFFQGAGGAVAAQDKFSRDAAATKQAAEDRELKLDDRAWSRSKDMASEKRATSKEARDERKAKLDNLTAVQKLMQDIGGQLTVEQRFKLNDQLDRYADVINKNGVLSPDELKEALKAERDRRIKDYTSGTILPSTEGAANPAPSAPEEAVKPAPNGTVYGATPESPATGGSGADKSQPAMPRNKTDFDNLPSGAYFINPSDGRVLLKK